jgi:hypothetical protein
VEIQKTPAEATQKHHSLLNRQPIHGAKVIQKQRFCTTNFLSILCDIRLLAALSAGCGLTCTGFYLKSIQPFPFYICVDYNYAFF